MHRIAGSFPRVMSINIPTTHSLQSIVHLKVESEPAFELPRSAQTQRSDKDNSAKEREEDYQRHRHFDSYNHAQWTQGADATYGYPKSPDSMTTDNTHIQSPVQMENEVSLAIQRVESTHSQFDQAETQNESSETFLHAGTGHPPSVKAESVSCNPTFSIDIGKQNSVIAVPPKDRVVISFGRGVPLAEIGRGGLRSDLHGPAFHRGSSLVRKASIYLGENNMGQWDLRRGGETGEPIDKKEMAELIKRLVCYYVSNKTEVTHAGIAIPVENLVLERV
ncbi:hypothetical protein C8Q74DRAFT_1222813 [Fomes fomentarius]|nr:hypothetical protein C8Q74DRAFT_1222813 [Fomes fomentarius]